MVEEAITHEENAVIHHEMKNWEIQAALAWFMHRLTQLDRRELMRDLPGVYNKLCEREIMVAVRVEDFDRLGKSCSDLTAQLEEAKAEAGELEIEVERLNAMLEAQAELVVEGTLELVDG